MANIRDLVTRFMSLSDQLRTGYEASLDVGVGVQAAEAAIGGLVRPAIPPTLLIELYSRYGGSPRSLREQTLMDFLPGFRLLELGEVQSEAVRLRGSQTLLVPFLGNFSSDFLCIGASPGEPVYQLAHDDPEPQLLHRSSEDFLLTQIAFYEEGVYFLDDDGYLDYDFDRQGELGARLNPSVDYWLG